MSLASIELCLSLGVLGFIGVDIGLFQNEGNKRSVNFLGGVVVVGCLLGGVGYASFSIAEGTSSSKER